MLQGVIIKFLFFWLFTLSFVFAQKYELRGDKKHQKIKFELVNNLIVIPIEVNGTQLSFVLDTGVSTPILFNLADKDSVQLNNVSEITINGLGEGSPINALSSKGNIIRLEKMYNPAQQMYVVMDAGINFSPSLGIPIHGIIGYDLFKDFVVDINYKRQTIKFFRPEKYRHKISKNTRLLDITVVDKKSYLDAKVVIKDGQEIPVKMLVDTGSSNAVWLFEDKVITVPDTNYDDFLGKGLSGNIYGKRTKINQIKISDFVLKDAKAAFPDMATFNSKTNFRNRNGSLGGEILKRFNMVFDYQNEKIKVKKNSNFGKSFQYNISGIDLQHAGVRYISERIADVNGIVYNENKTYGNVQILMEGATRLSVVPEIIVSGIRQGSPAYSAGLKEGDVILAVNGKRIYRYKLQEILHMLNNKKQKKVKILVQRSNNDLLFSFDLEPLFKQ